VRESLSLDDVWQFYPAFGEICADQRWLDPDFDPAHPEAGAAADRGWIEPGFDDSGWLEAPVPSSWNKAFPDLWSYEGTGWYRKRIRIPDRWRGRRVWFFSEGANYRTVVYVNGRRAGSHDGGYTPFSIPVAEHLNYGAENVLAISCDNVPQPDRVPGGQFDWWNHGGLYRSISLIMAGDPVIEDATIVAAPEGSGGKVSVAVRVRSAREAGAVSCRLRLFDPDGNAIASQQSTAALLDGAAEFRFDAIIENVRPWSPDHPDLYAAHLSAAGEGGEEDAREVRFGVRSIEVRGTQLLLNGEPLLIKGVNRYEDYPTTGRSLDETFLRADLDRVKWLGGNTLRCHFPNHRRHYEICDEIGLLNLVELPLNQWGRPLVKTDSAEALEGAKAQLAEMIGALKNHPSVFMWSVSNENLTHARSGRPEDVALAEQTARGNIELVELARRLDPTRPVVEVSNCWPEDPALAHTDLCAVNVYAGVEGGAYSSRLPALAAEMKRRLLRLREKYPAKPILAAEFGAWTIPGLRTDYFPGELYQANFLRAVWDMLMEVPGLVGGIIWCFADSDVHRRFEWVYELRVAYGLFDFHRRPKASAAAVRERWTGEPPPPEATM
jgi:beta-glucuronidase